MIEFKPVTRNMTVEGQVIEVQICNKAIAEIIQFLMATVTNFDSLHRAVKWNAMGGDEVNRRFTDRLLQRLRKEGLIEFKLGYWGLVQRKRA